MTEVQSLFKNVALVCDWMIDIGGAERVFFELMKLFPHADIYTSVCLEKHKKMFEGRKVYVSFIQSIPWIYRYHKLCLFLRPYAFESFDFSKYDLVISSSSAESKGIITKPSTLHICYCHTPTRYFWSHYHEYMHFLEFWVWNVFARFMMPSFIHRLREWDFVAAQRVDYFLANSYNTKRRIAKYYKRDAEVVYPCIDWNSFFVWEKEDFYLCVWRVVPYKKFDLLVDVFNNNKKPLVILTSTRNHLQKKLQKKSRSNIIWKIGVGEKEKRWYYSKAKAFVFPADEDFWMVMVEAIASGTPVIAYASWWAKEIVKEWENGMFFFHQTPESLQEAIEAFEKRSFDGEMIRKSAQSFDVSVFHENVTSFLQRIYT